MNQEKVRAVQIMCRDAKDEFYHDKKLRDVLVNIGSYCILVLSEPDRDHWEASLSDYLEFVVSKYDKLKPIQARINKILGIAQKEGYLK